MAYEDCPQCRHRLEKFRGDYECPQCGWNENDDEIPLFL